MTIDENDIRDLCTEAVFERGKNYREEGRIQHLTRTGESITALVQGTRRYKVTLDMSVPDLAPACSCPFAGPGACKHVVAVLLALTDELPADEEKQVNTLLDDVPREPLRDFVRDELIQNPALRERFFARFGEPTDKSIDDYRTEIDHLFEEYTQESPTVMVAIDFSRFTDLAEQYQKRGAYQSAAAIYRAVAEGIDENMHLVDAAYDHYTRTFSTVLDAYVDCVSNADLGAEELRDHIEFLSERVHSGTDFFRSYYAAAVADLQEQLQ